MNVLSEEKKSLRGDDLLDQETAAMVAEVGTELPTMPVLEDVLAHLVSGGESWVRRFLGDDIAETLIESLIEKGNTQQLDPFDRVSRESDWPGQIGRRTRLYRAMENLRGYAEEGVCPGTVTAQTVECVEKALAHCLDTLPLLPKEWLKEEADAPLYQGLWLVFGKAKARYRLEQGQRLMLHEIALLSNMALKSVRNASQKRHGEKRLLIERDDTVTAENSLRWLLERRGFVPSSREGIEKKEVVTSSRPEDYVFVPVDETGVAFLPGEITSVGPRAGIYAVELDGEREEIPGYLDALERMVSAHEVAWYSVAKGGRASGVGWQKYSKLKLRRMELELIDSQLEQWDEAAEQFLKENPEFGRK